MVVKLGLIPNYEINQQKMPIGNKLEQKKKN